MIDLYWFKFIIIYLLFLGYQWIIDEFIWLVRVLSIIRIQYRVSDHLHMCCLYDHTYICWRVSVLQTSPACDESSTECYVSFNIHVMYCNWITASVTVTYYIAPLWSHIDHMPSKNSWYNERRAIVLQPVSHRYVKCYNVGVVLTSESCFNILK